MHRVLNKIYLEIDVTFRDESNDDK